MTPSRRQGIPLIRGAGSGSAWAKPAFTSRLLAGVLAVVLAGCTSTVPGAAHKEMNTGNPDDVSVALLDTGSYPVTAGHPFGVAGEKGGGMFEGQRMADSVYGPWQVDAMLRQPEPLATLSVDQAILPSSDTLPDPLPAVAAAHGYITGFSSMRKSPNLNPRRALQNMVMRFPDPPSAAAAAQEMFANGSSQGSPRPVPISDHPEASALVYPRIDGGVAVRSFTAHGPYVLNQLAITTHDYDNEFEARLLVSGALSQQEPWIDRFVPTDPAKLADLPIDPSGWLLARVLWAPDGKVPRSAGVWPPKAALHFETDPIEADALFSATGVEWMAQRLTRVYQTKSPDGAARIVAKFAEQALSMPAVHTIPSGVRGMPSAKCFVRAKGFSTPPEAPTIVQAQWHFMCIARADRFAFLAFSPDEKDAMQQVAAQWRILAGK